MADLPNAWESTGQQFYLSINSFDVPYFIFWKLIVQSLVVWAQLYTATKRRWIDGKFKREIMPVRTLCRSLAEWNLFTKIFLRISTFKICTRFVPFSKRLILPRSVFHTDSHWSYMKFPRSFYHFTVNHSRNSIDHNETYTSLLEGIFVWLKKNKA